MKHAFSMILSAVIFSAITLQTARGDEAQIKNNMLARKPQIEALKNAGQIGEDNKGFLGVVAEKLEDASTQVVTAENSDRTQVYTAIAKKQGTTPDLVGKRRSVQLAEQAKPGDYIMNASGKWEKKK